jgi:hypothetical protein
LDQPHGDAGAHRHRPCKGHPSHAGFSTGARVASNSFANFPDRADSAPLKNVLHCSWNGLFEGCERGTCQDCTAPFSENDPKPLRLSAETAILFSGKPHRQLPANTDENTGRIVHPAGEAGEGGISFLIRAHAWLKNENEN